MICGLHRRISQYAAEAIRIDHGSEAAIRRIDNDVAYSNGIVENLSYIHQ
jgi:hypothetical protein